MTYQDDITRIGDRLHDALGAAADVMAQTQAATRQAVKPAARPGTTRSWLRRDWLVPLAAAAAVVALVLGSVLATGGFGRTAARPGITSPTPDSSAPPEFYLTLWPPPDHPGTSVLQVHRTSDGTLTGSMPFPGLMLQEGYLTADASDREFYVASWPSCTSAVPVSRFYRITITGSGQISGYHAVGVPVSGIVNALAVSPDGSRMAYAIQSTERCVNPPFKEPSPSAVHIMDLATGSVRTWQNTVRTATPTRILELANGLSWTPDGRTLVVNYIWSAGDSPGRWQENVAVLALDTTSSGGSIQAHSRLLLHASPGCVTCLVDALAGPGSSLTVSEVQTAGSNPRLKRVVLVQLGGGQRDRVLFSSPVTDSSQVLSEPAIFADPSGRYLIIWPLTDMSGQAWTTVSAGWISGGTVHRLPGTSLVFSNAIAW